jgi:hypothetical protein
MSFDWLASLAMMVKCGRDQVSTLSSTFYSAGHHLMRVALQRVALTARSARFITSSSSIHADAPSASDSGTALSPTGKKYPKFLRRTRQDEEEMLWDLDDVEEEDERHMSSFGWEIWHQQRDFFNTMRTLERDGPVLESRSSILVKKTLQTRFSCNCN